MKKRGESYEEAHDDGAGGHAGTAADRGCGSTKEETKSVDLTEFYNGLAEEYEWDENYMASIEGDLLESYYPGLGDISTKQFIAMTPQMSAVVNELVFLEAETEEDAEKAAEILQKRIDDQAAGGAWYPESMEAWGRGQVIQEGTSCCHDRLRGASGGDRGRL